VVLARAVTVDNAASAKTGKRAGILEGRAHFCNWALRLADGILAACQNPAGNRPMNSLLHTLPHILPIAEAFVAEHEKIILARGEPLTAFELTDARAAGVKHPEKIRVLRIDHLPLPERDEVLFIAKRMGLFQTNSAALALHYGIYLQRPYWNDRRKLVHEFVLGGQRHATRFARALSPRKGAPHPAA
jgi:hypothetical protein